METMDVSGYHRLFGDAGASLTDSEWVEHANRNLTPNLSALNARYLEVLGRSAGCACHSSRGRVP
jgi:hypothetical protein